MQAPSLQQTRPTWTQQWPQLQRPFPPGPRRLPASARATCARSLPRSGPGLRVLLPHWAALPGLLYPKQLAQAQSILRFCSLSADQGAQGAAGAVESLDNGKPIAEAEGDMVSHAQQLR